MRRLSAGASPRLAATVLLVLAACGRTEPVDDELVLADSIVVRDAAVLEIGVELFRSLALATSDDGVLILDGGNKRVVRLTAELKFGGAVGSVGSGPGEFKFALDIAARADTVAIGDIGNGRIMFLDLATGREVRTTPVPSAPASFAIMADGSALVPSATAGFYLVRVSADGAAEPFAPRPDTTFGSSANILVRSCGTHVYVFDNDELLLTRYSATGDLVGNFRLPAPILARLVGYRMDTADAFRKQGISVLSATTVKTLALVDCNRPLLLFTDDNFFGLVVDAERALAHPLLLPENPQQRAVLRNAGGLAVVGSRFIVLRDDELWSYAYR